MPVPIFDQPVITEKHDERPTSEIKKFSGWTIFFSILLIIVFVIIVERAFKDVNKLYNPLYQSCQEVKQNTFFTLKITEAEKECQISQYEFTRLILHLDIVGPLAIIGIVLYFFARRSKRIASYLKIIIYSYSMFVLWILLRIISETEYFLLKHYRMIGIYIVLLTIAIIFISLIIVIQRKFSHKVKEFAPKENNFNY